MHLMSLRELLKEPVRSLVEPSFQGTTANESEGNFSSAAMVLWNCILDDYGSNARMEAIQFHFHAHVLLILSAARLIVILLTRLGLD